MPERFYGQQGEDKILYEVFKCQDKGFYVDVGASDGIRFSNTYIFEQLGWNGICIEPNPAEFAKLKANRPNSLCLHAMAGEKEGCGWLLPGVDGINRRLLEPGQGTIPVAMATLSFFFAIFDVSLVDFISIDAEYTDEKVLEGLELSIYHPRVVVVEQDNKFIEKQFARAGYLKARRHYFNSFFCREQKDADIICSVEPHMENGEPI